MTITGKSGRKYTVETEGRGTSKICDGRLKIEGLTLAYWAPGTSSCQSIEEALASAEKRANELKLEL